MSSRSIRLMRLMDIKDLVGKRTLGFWPSPIDDMDTALRCIRRGYRVAKYLFVVRLIIAVGFIAIGSGRLPAVWASGPELDCGRSMFLFEALVWGWIARGIYRKSQASCTDCRSVHTANHWPRSAGSQ
jgi:hypothetical protein